MASSGVPRLLNSVLVVDSAPPGPGFVAALVGELSRAGHAVTQVASFRAAKAVVGSDAGQGLSAVVVALPSPEYEEREHPQAFGRKTDPSGAPASLTWSVPDRPGRPRSTSPSRFSDSGESRASTLRSPEIIIAGALADAPQPATSPVLRRRGDELAEDLVRTVRAKINVEVPIAILAEPGEDDDAEEQGLPDWVSQLTNEIIFKDEQSASHVASRLSAKITKYVSSILAAAPFFDALVRFAREAHYSWHTPGHSGGQAFLRTPTGSAFHSFFGEPLFRTDLSVSVAQLGSLNDHTGPLKLAERRAAKLFGADRTYFVTNGTSTSNRIIIGACVTRGDRTLVDRNCHKSVIQGMQMTGGVPTYLLPKRNGLGIIGPVPPAALTKEAIWASIRANPLSSSYDGPEDIVYAVVTNSTYDGLCYHAGRVKSLLDPSGLMRLSFDEAWFAYARFHPLYRNRFAMQSLEDDGARRASTSRRPLSGTGPNGLNATAPALGRPLPTGPTVLATHSTHKLLASLSQAALLHIRQGSRGQIDHARFNESFMMNSSTSPQYAIMASIDVAGAMMENSMPGRIGDGTGLPSGSLPSGPSTDGAPGTARASWGSTVISASIIEAVRFRRRMVRMGDSYRAQEMRNRMRAQERAKANGLPMPEDDPNVLSPGWWFEVWQPTVVPGSMTVPASERKPFVEVDFDRLISDPDCWLLHPDDEWHGFKGLEDGYCLLDPIKVTILTPGGNVDGSICGIPAAIVTKFLDKRGIQVEKTGDYSLLFLFSIGVTESKW